MKFFRKYVGLLHHTKQEGVCIPQGLFEGGGVDAQELVKLVFLAQREKQARKRMESHLQVYKYRNCNVSCNTTERLIR